MFSKTFLVILAEWICLLYISEHLFNSQFLGLIWAVFVHFAFCMMIRYGAEADAQARFDEKED